MKNHHVAMFVVWGTHVVVQASGGYAQTSHLVAMTALMTIFTVRLFWDAWRNLRGIAEIKWRVGSKRSRG